MPFQVKYKIKGINAIRYDTDDQPLDSGFVMKLSKINEDVDEFNEFNIDELGEEDQFGRLALGGIIVLRPADEYTTQNFWKKSKGWVGTSYSKFDLLQDLSRMMQDKFGTGQLIETSAKTDDGYEAYIGSVVFNPYDFDQEEIATVVNEITEILKDKYPNPIQLDNNMLYHWNIVTSHPNVIDEY